MCSRRPGRVLRPLLSLSSLFTLFSSSGERVRRGDPPAFPRRAIKYFLIMGLSDIFTSLKSQGRSQRSATTKVKVVKITQQTKAKRNASPQLKQSLAKKTKGALVKGKAQKAARGPRKGKGIIMRNLYLCYLMSTYRGEGSFESR